VETAAREMAALFGEDPERAARAGLIHDCAKNMTEGEQWAAMGAEGYAVDAIMAASPALWHAPAGAYVARTCLNEQDPEVLDAITYHTVPSLNPTKLATILLIADMVEPSRDFPGVEMLRKAAKKDLQEAFILALASPMIFELGRINPVHPNTLTVYNRLILLKRGIGNATIK
jgi:predicted HD superfamily hydrolase involved in NAD metabolism